MGKKLIEINFQFETKKKPKQNYVKFAEKKLKRRKKTMKKPKKKLKTSKKKV